MKYASDLIKLYSPLIQNIQDTKPADKSSDLINTGRDGLECLLNAVMRDLVISKLERDQLKLKLSDNSSILRHTIHELLHLQVRMGNLLSGSADVDILRDVESTCGHTLIDSWIHNEATGTRFK